MKKTVFLFVLIFFPAASKAQNSGPTLLLSGDEYFRSFLYAGGEPTDYDLGTLRKIYTYNEEKHVFEPLIQNLPGNCYYVSASISGEMIAALVAVKQPGDENGQNVMQIFDSKGRLVLDVPDVYAFKWLPSQTRVVYLSGRWSETDELGGFIPTGTWILDLATMNKERIYEAGYSISFEERSSTVYIDTYRKVYAYNTKSKRLQETTFKGNNFSPSGEYYYRDPSVYRPLIVYETRTNRPILTDSSKTYTEWMAGKDHTLIVGDYWAEKNIIDVKTRKSLGTLSGKIMGYDVTKKEFLLLKGKQYEKQLPKSRVERVRID